MRLFRWFIFTLAFCTLLPNLGGCTSRDTAPPTTPDDRAEQVNTSEPDRSLRRAPQVDTTLTAYEKQIREQLSTGKALLESGELKNDLTRFYENRHFTPVWMTTDGATRAVEALLETLRTPTPGGPFTPSYAVDRLRQRLG